MPKVGELREFPVEVLASLTTQIGLVEFGQLHECAEWVMGVPIFTHNFADERFARDMRDTVLDAVPTLPVKLNKVTPANVHDMVSWLRITYGEKFTVPYGDSKRAPNFSAGLKRLGRARV